MMNAQETRARIDEALPNGSVIAEHTPKGHFYRIMTADKNGEVGNVYPSVTGKLQVLKDESLINYKMNQALQYVFAHYKEFNDANIMERLDLAARTSADVLTDAGDVGRIVHEARERFFREWIRSGVMPADISAFIPAGAETDIRVVSAVRALGAFIKDYDYEPIATELFVFCHRLKVAGTLDDIGIMMRPRRKGSESCLHENMRTISNVVVCLKCGRRSDRRLVLIDLKTSNQFKDHYFFQVALYYQMFVELTGIKPNACYIVKLSKTDGTYKLERLQDLPRLMAYARAMLKTNEGLSFIGSIRRDNQKTVGSLIEL